MTKQTSHYTVKNGQIQQVNGAKEVNKESVGESDSFALAKYSSLGYYLVTPLLMGVFFGLFLDRVKNVSPWGILIGISLGTIGTFYNLYRMTRDN